jgi:NAD(P)-dependent dehydrogenase (short-subunit alcohol dehydrogenase family)
MNYGDGTKAYYQSKLANVMHSKELARRLSGSGINVYCLHPGKLGYITLDSSMENYLFMLTKLGTSL